MHVHCKYTLLYAIKKLFISNKKLAPLTYWFVPVWKLQGSGNKDLNKMTGSNRNGIRNGKCDIMK